MKIPLPKDAMRASLTMLLVLGFGAALAALFAFTVPATNRDMVVYMLGQLSGFAGAGVYFYLGTSKSSSDKNKLLVEAQRPLDLSGAEAEQ